MTQLIHISKVKTRNVISTGDAHSLVVASNGRVYSFGQNCFGQLGLGDNINRNTPTLVSKLNKIVSIFAGKDVSFALTSDGDVYSFGLNYDKLGLSNVPRHKPVFIPTLSLIKNISSISTGYNHSLAVTSDGNVYAFGCDTYGQLGLGRLNIQQNNNIPILIPTLKNIILTSAGKDHSLALPADGHVYSFGNNRQGQLGLNDKISRRIPTLIPELNNIYISWVQTIICINIRWLFL